MMPLNSLGTTETGCNAGQALYRHCTATWMPVNGAYSFVSPHTLYPTASDKKHETEQCICRHHGFDVDDLMFLHRRHVLAGVAKLVAAAHVCAVTDIQVASYVPKL